MKTWIKVVLWILVVAAVVLGGLFAVGYNMHKKVETFMIDKGAENVVVMGNSDIVLCPGNATGMIVKANGPDEEGEPLYFPICSTLTGDVTIGKFSK